MNTSATRGEESAADVLQDAAPLSRDDLHDPEVVEALWQRADTHPSTRQSLFGVSALIHDSGGVDTDGNIFQADLAAALNFHGLTDLADKLVSSAFRDRLRVD